MNIIDNMLNKENIEKIINQESLNKIDNEKNIIATAIYGVKVFPTKIYSRIKIDGKVIKFITNDL